tara:strand:+ start:716 stop:1213 length:498 start_codon:yes stop_codon:yes gene_type:complete
MELYGLNRTMVPFLQLKSHSGSLDIPSEVRNDFISFCDDRREKCSFSIGIFDKMEVWRTPYELYYAIYEFAHNSCRDFECSKYFAFFKYQNTDNQTELVEKTMKLLERLYDLEEKVGGHKVDAFVDENNNCIYLRLWNKKIKVCLSPSYTEIGSDHYYLEFHIDY